MTPEVELFLSAAPHFIEESMRALIRQWSDPPSALQILEVLDKCIHGDLACGTFVAILQMMYTEAYLREGTTHEALVPLAVWRRL